MNLLGFISSSQNIQNKNFEFFNSNVSKFAKK